MSSGGRQVPITTVPDTVLLAAGQAATARGGPHGPVNREPA
jgi:hypothetical protein